MEKLKEIKDQLFTEQGTKAMCFDSTDYSKWWSDSAVDTIVERANERLSTEHAKMVEMLTKMLSFKQYQRVEDFVSIEEINDLLSSIKKGGSDAV